MESISKIQRTLRKALLAGGEVIRRGFPEVRRVTYKAPVSPVTTVDLNAQRKIIQIISSVFPAHRYLAEESSILKTKQIQNQPGDGIRWIIDPLDGTTNFVHRIPQSGVSIAAERNGQLLAGGIYDPFRDELYLAVHKKGATLNGKRIHVSRQSKMIKALFITGFPYDRLKKGRKYLKLIEPFLMHSMGVRRFGAAAIDMAWVACGRAEGFFERKLSPWDVAAGESGREILAYDLNHARSTGVG